MRRVAHCCDSVGAGGQPPASPAATKPAQSRITRYICRAVLWLWRRSWRPAGLATCQPSTSRRRTHTQQQHQQRLVRGVWVEGQGYEPGC